MSDDRCKVATTEVVAAERTSPGRALERLVALQEVTAEFSQVATQAEIARIVVTRGVSVLGARRGLMALVGPDGVHLEIVGAVGYASDAIQLFQGRSVNEPLPLPRAIRRNEPIFIEDVGSETPYDPALGKAALMTGAAALAAVPLAAGGRVLGGLGFSYDQPRPFDEEDRPFFLALARQCAQALDRARLYESERGARTRAERVVGQACRLERVTSRLARAMTASEIAEATIDEGTGAIEADVGALWLLSPDGTSREMVRSAGMSDQAVGSFGRLAMNRSVPVADSILRRQPIWLESWDEYQRLYPESLERVLRSEAGPGEFSTACLPLFIDSQMLGCLALAFLHDRTIDEDERSFMVTLSRHVALALERVRLFDAQQRTAERLSAANRMFETVVSASPTAIMVLDLDGTVRLWNEASQRIFGWSEAEVLGGFVPTVDETQRDQLVADLARIVGGERMMAVEARLLTKDRGAIDVAVWAACIRDPAGKIQCVSIVADISDRKRAEEAHETARQALQLAEERMRLAVEATRLGTWDLMIPTGSLSWDQRCRELFQVPPGAPITCGTFIDAVHPEDAERVRLAIDRATAPGSDGRYEAEFRAITWRDREVRWITARGQCLFDPQGNPVRFVGTMVDVTDDKRAAEELKRSVDRAQQAYAAAQDAERRKDEFLAMLGHELRNPLAPIQTALQLIRLRGDHALERERTIIERQVRHLERLVSDLLDVSRITQGKIQLKKERLEMAEIIAKALELTRPLLEQRDHKLTLNVPYEGLLVEGDHVRLTQVMTNLLTNAAKYTEPGGNISVHARREGDEVIARVKDSGAGLSPELLPAVFDLFTQASQTLARSEGGLGLGLTIAKSLVEMHGGRIEAFSDGLGRGSEFVVRLPASGVAKIDQEPDAGASLAREPGQHPSARVLVVDDNRDAVEILAETLQIEGHHVDVAYDGPSALEIAARCNPDVVLLDIGLPVLDGYEVARRLRRQSGGDQMNLIAVTGYGQECDRARAVEAGFDEHLVKPVDLHVLLHTVEQYAHAH
jgi:PAS domain S-box-containing protein